MSHNLQGKDVVQWRERTGLTQEGAARRLGIAREWLSKIENGRVPVSADIFLKIEALKREVENTSIPRVEDSRAPFPAINPAVASLRASFEDLLAIAGDDPDRLGWIRVQMAEHLRPPKGWVTHEETNARAVELSKKLSEAARSRSSDRNTRRTGAASA